jgi:hypothetical protein
MSNYILVVDDETDVENLFCQQFRRDIRTGRLIMEFATSAPEEQAPSRIWRRFELSSSPTR